MNAKERAAVVLNRYTEAATPKSPEPYHITPWFGDPAKQDEALCGFKALAAVDNMIRVRMIVEEGKLPMILTIDSDKHLMRYPVCKRCEEVLYELGALCISPPEEAPHR